MAKFRNVSADERRVGYGLPRPRIVKPDELLEVPDELIENYDQPDIWELVEGERPKTEENTAPASTDEVHTEPDDGSEENHQS